MANEVRRTTFRERYHRLLNHLRTKILSGEWMPGDYIPPENELAKTFQMSRPSVRKVLSELACEGLIHTMHGKGSVVSEFNKTFTVLNLFWAMPSFEYNVISRIVDRFNQTNKRIKVEITQIPRETFVAAASEGAFMGRMKPDLLGIGNNHFLYMADRQPEKLLQPIRIDAEDFYAPFLRAFSCGEHLLAAPITFSPIIMVYNKTMFDKRKLDYPDDSWTWRELLDAAKALTEYDGGQAEQYGFSFSATTNRWPLFVLQNGGKFADKGRLFPDDPRTLEALRFTADLMYKHNVSPIFSTGHASSGEELFLRQKVGMILTSYLFMEQFNDIEFEWDFVRFPGRVREAGFGLATGIGISSYCSSVEAARQFIDFICSEPIQAYIKYHVCSIPARKSVAESRTYPHYPLAGKRYYTFETFVDHLQTIKDFGLTYPQFDKMEKELGLLWANIASVETVWKTLQHMIE